MGFRWISCAESGCPAKPGVGLGLKPRQISTQQSSMCGCFDPLQVFKMLHLQKSQFPWFPCSFPWSDCLFYAIILQSLEELMICIQVHYINYINLLLGWGVRPAYKSNRHGQRAGHQLGKNCLGLDDVHDNLFESYQLEICFRKTWLSSRFIHYIIFTLPNLFFLVICRHLCSAHAIFWHIFTHAYLTPWQHPVLQ